MEKEKQYQWKIESFAKNIDVNEAIKEFKKIEKRYGAITPENIVTAATSRNSIFHSVFEWDDSTAAKHYRLQQARTLINNIEVTIVSDEGSQHIPVFEIITVKDKGRQYKHIETLTFNEIEQVKHTTLATLKQLNNKLRIYKEFNTVLPHVENAISSLHKTKVSNGK